jgi:hypothetical protein
MYICMTNIDFPLIVTAAGGMIVFHQAQFIRFRRYTSRSTSRYWKLKSTDGSGHMLVEQQSRNSSDAVEPGGGGGDSRINPADINQNARYQRWIVLCVSAFVRAILLVIFFLMTMTRKGIPTVVAGSTNTASYSAREDWIGLAGNASSAQG